jgi:predicted Rossmann-fold nucleotide-binding protein
MKGGLAIFALALCADDRRPAKKQRRDTPGMGESSSRLCTSADAHSGTEECGFSVHHVALDKVDGLRDRAVEIHGVLRFKSDHVHAPPGLIVGFVGSTRFYNKTTSKNIIKELVKMMYALNKLVYVTIVTGGTTGVAQYVDKVAHTLDRDRSARNIVHHKRECHCVHGEQIIAGASYAERRAVLGYVADVVVVIEGGPGTKDEVRHALANGRTVLAIRATGGVAAVNLVGVTGISGADVVGTTRDHLLLAAKVVP